MSISTWLRKLTQSPSHVHRLQGAASKWAGFRSRRRRPALELLEDRLAPALIPIHLAPIDVSGVTDVQENVNSNRTIAVAANGNFAVVEDDAGGVGVYARLFKADGTPLTPLIAVATDTSGTNDQATVAMNDSGQFVVAWRFHSPHDMPGGFSFDQILAQRYNANGTPSGSQLVVVGGGLPSRPSVAMDTAGDLVIAYQRDLSVVAAGDNDVQLVRLSPTNQQTNYPHAFDNSGLSYSEVHAYLPSVAMNATGQFVLVFTDYPGTGSGRIVAQPFTASGAFQRPAIGVNSYLGNATQPSVAMNSSGTFVVAYTDITGTTLTDTGQILYRTQTLESRYDGSANFLGRGTVSPDFLPSALNSYSPSAAIDGAGNFMVAYTYGSSLSGDDPSLSYPTILGSLYDSHGALQQVNIPLAADPDPSSNLHDDTPSVALSASGLVASWETYGKNFAHESFTTGVYAQVFRSNSFSLQLTNVPGGQAFPVIQGIPAQVSVQINRDPGFTAPIGLTLSPGVSGLLVQIGPARSAGTLELHTITITAKPGSPTFAALNVTASSGGVLAQSLPLSLQITPYAVTDVEPRVVNEPQELQPGTTVTITGSGFVPGMTVQFGSGASAPEASINHDATSITVQVPFGAVDGPLTLTRPGETIMLPPTTQMLTVHSFRDTNGFNFGNNFDVPITFDMVQNAFGYDQTHIGVKVFGIGVTTPLPNPAALAFLAAANATHLGDGICFGFSLSELNFLHNPGMINAQYGLNAGQPATIYNLNYNDTLTAYLEQNQLVQWSQELLTYKASTGGMSGTDLYAQLQGLLQSGPAIISIRDFGHGHAVVAYDLQGTPDNFYIDVYDPNRPFDPNTDRTSNNNEMSSRIQVTGNAWSFNGNFALPPDQQTWSGDLIAGGLRVTPYSQVPQDPTLPGSAILDLASLLIVFGSPSELPTVSLSENGALTVDAFAEPDTTNNVATISTAAGSVKVTLNNQVYQYAAGAVKNITFVGNDGSDTINLESVPAGIPTDIYLGSGASTINLSATAHNLHNILGDVTILGNSGVDTVNLNDQANAATSTYTLNGSSITRTGARTISFQAIDNINLNGGGGVETYNIQDTGPGHTALSLGSGHNITNVQGSTGPLAITGVRGSSQFVIGSKSSTLATIHGPIAITGAGGACSVRLLDSGSTAATTYSVQAVMSPTQRTLKAAQVPAPQTAQIQSGNGPAFTCANVGQLAIQTSPGGATVAVQSVPTGVVLSLIASGGHNSLIGPDAASAWDLTGPDTGTLDTTVQFQGFGNLHGGSAADGFRIEPAVIKNGAVLHPAGSLSGTLDGGGGANTLDYSPYTGDVTVDLPLGLATAIGQGVANIQAVLGGLGNDLLVGAAGTTSLQAGAGRNMLIAGLTPATLTGGPGEDVMVGGTTDDDLTVAALNALMAEWKRTDLGSAGDPTGYQARVNHLLHGGGLNGATVLNSAEFHGNAGGNHLTGGAALDLFYGSKALDANDWNAGQGEQFIEEQAHQNTQIDARALSMPTVAIDSTTFATSGVGSFSLSAGTHTLSIPGGGSVTFYVAGDGTVDYDRSLDSVISGRGTTTLLIKGVQVTIDATRLSTSTLLVDNVQEHTSAVFSFTALPGNYVLKDFSNQSTPITISVGAGGAVGYDSSLEGILTGAGSATLTIHGATVTIDATRLSTAAVLVDNLQEHTSAAFSFTALPGNYLLKDFSNQSTPMTFSLGAGGAVGYDPSLEGILTGAGTATLTVRGATVTIDATRLSTAAVLVDNVTEHTATAFAFTALPGNYLLKDFSNQSTPMTFSIGANGTVGYDPSLEGVLTGAGAAALTLHGATVTIDATRLSTATVLVDNLQEHTNTAFSFTALPGNYLLKDFSNQSTPMTFSVGANGTVGYDPSLEGILTGAGTAALTVHGVTVTVDATRLSTADVLVDNLQEHTSTAFSFTALPGNYLLKDFSNQSTPMTFSVAANGTVGYDSSLEGILTGAGTAALTVHGVTVTVDATRLSTADVLVDNLQEHTSAAFSFTALPGNYLLKDFSNQSTPMTFSVGASGTIGYDSSLEGILTGTGTAALTVHGVTVTIDATRLSTAAVLVDNLQEHTSAAFTFTALPGNYLLKDFTNQSTPMTFSVGASGTVGYDPSLEGILTGAGTAALTVHGVTVIIDATHQPSLAVVDSSIGVNNTSLFAFTTLPGIYTLRRAGGATALHFTVNANGTVDYDPSFDSFLSGRSTSTLVVVALPL
jgi:hypothetical protein